MSDVINLRRERKRRKSVEDAKLADANRRLHGRTRGKNWLKRLKNSGCRRFWTGENFLPEHPRTKAKILDAEGGGDYVFGTLHVRVPKCTAVIECSNPVTLLCTRVWP